MTFQVGEERAADLRGGCTPKSPGQLVMFPEKRSFDGANLLCNVLNGTIALPHDQTSNDELHQISIANFSVRTDDFTCGFLLRRSTVLYREPIRIISVPFIFLINKYYFKRSGCITHESLILQEKKPLFDMEKSE